MIRILTDSASDITAKEAKDKGMEFVQLNIQFPGIAYDQYQDEDFSTFYQLLQTEKVFPKTSQPPPEAFAAIFQAAKEAGDSVVAILISSGLSGTIQSAQVAKELVDYEDIHIIDSRCAIMPQRILVEYAVSLRDAGGDVDTIVQKVSEIRDRVKVYGMIDTLTYLYKGGRLSKTVALAGNLLHIRPLITAKNGVIALVGRGRNHLALVKRFEEMGYDPDFPVYFGYSADDSNCNKLMHHVLEHHPEIEKTGMFPIGGVVGAHVGPNGMAISFVPKA